MEIKYDPKRKSPYYVDFYLNGIRRRKFFATKALAKQYAARVVNAKSQFGARSLIFDAKSQADFLEARRLLDCAGLEESISVFIARNLQKPENKVKQQSVMAAYDEYLELKTKLGRSKQTLCDIRSDVRRFCVAHAKKTLDRLTKQDVEQYVVNSKWSPRTCRNQLTLITSFLNYCASRNWLRFEPVFNHMAILPRELKKPKAVYSADTICDFFQFLESSKYRRFASFYAIQAFCGVRRAEAERGGFIIDTAKRTITIPAETTKTGDEWTIRDAPDNLWAWLAKYPTICYPHDKMGVQLKREWGGKWENNGLRHTFATMHVSLHQNPAKTSLILRHRNQQRLWQNYLANPVAKEEAERYFAIVPAGTVE